jgi:hypothetical protein
LDQPRVAQEMLRRFVNEENIATGGEGGGKGEV